MRASLIFAVVLLLTPGLAWAAEAAPADGTPANHEVAPDGPIFEGGGCLLPDLAGLSADEAETALQGAGFDVSPVEAATPACPTTFDCTSITNCKAGSVCTVQNLGPCCSVGKFTLCCILGTIKVQRCACECKNNPCNLECPDSTNVEFDCS